MSGMETHSHWPDGRTACPYGPECDAPDPRYAAWDEGYAARMGFMALENEIRREDNPYVTHPCPRRACRGRVPHSRVVHWFGWVRR